MEGQNSFLKISINILKIFSYIFGALGIIGALIILLGKTPGSGKLASLGVLFVGGLYFYIFYMISEVIRLLLDMDERVTKIANSVQTPKREIR